MLDYFFLFLFWCVDSEPESESEGPELDGAGLGLRKLESQIS